MLYEILDVKQEAGEPFCRWFSDKYFDLFVWYNEDKSIYSFQLCYNKTGSERCIAWKSANNTFSHLKVDSGDRGPRSNMTPILLPDGIFKKNEIPELFKKNSAEIDEQLSTFIYNKILEY